MALIRKSQPISLIIQGQRGTLTFFDAESWAVDGVRRIVRTCMRRRDGSKALASSAFSSQTDESAQKQLDRPTVAKFAPLPSAAARVNVGDVTSRAAHAPSLTTNSVRLTPMAEASQRSRSTTTSLSGARAAEATSSRTQSESTRNLALASTAGTTPENR